MDLFAVLLVELLYFVPVIISSLSQSSVCNDMVSSPCRGEIKTPLVEALRSKMQGKNLSYDRKLEDVALTKLLLDDQWEYLFPEKKYTKELTFNETKAEGSPLDELANEFVKKAVELWSDDSETIEGTRFGCNFFVMASSPDESDGEEDVVAGKNEDGGASAGEDRDEDATHRGETYDYLLSCLFN
ncbi:hypothetical protein Aduo_008148 [Ancylostoma duodenale]